MICGYSRTQILDTGLILLQGQGEVVVASREKLVSGVIRVKVQVQDKLLLIPVIDR